MALDPFQPSSASSQQSTVVVSSFPWNICSGRILAGEGYIILKEIQRRRHLYRSPKQPEETSVRVSADSKPKVTTTRNMETPVDGRVTNKAGMMEMEIPTRKLRPKIEGYAMRSKMSKRNEMKAKYMQHEQMSHRLEVEHCQKMVPCSSKKTLAFGSEQFFCLTHSHWKNSCTLP